MKVQVNSIHVNVRERGAGEPALVFLHYWGGSSRTWDGVASRLAYKVRCIATDHRGWGESDAPRDGYRIADLADDAQAVIESLRLRNYVLVGHSMGGKTAQLLASRRPQGLKGLVLVAPSPASPTDVGAEQRETMIHAYDSPESIAFVRDNILTARPLDDALKALVVEDSLRGAMPARVAWPSVAMLEDYSGDMARIDVSTLVISGDRDQVDTLDTIRREVMPRIARAQLKVLEGVGHLSPLEAPAEIASSIGEFLAQVA